MKDKEKKLQPIILQPYQEIIGTITDIKIIDENVSIIFSNHKYITIPIDEINVDVLEESNNKKIGILNYEEQYKFRKIN